MGINRAVTKYLSRVFDWIARGVQKIKYKFQVRRANAPDRAARRTANATWVIALFTAVTTVVGFAQWRALHHTDERIGQQVEAMGRVLTLMESDQRPWIKISDVKLVTPVTFKASGGSAAISIEAINVGKSVALNVYPPPICTYLQVENILMPYRPSLVRPAIRILCHLKSSPQRANLFSLINQPTGLML